MTHTPLDPAVALAPAPCCICPPRCAADETGETCADSSCAWCLFGCPAPLGTRCCLDTDIAHAFQPEHDHPTTARSRS